MPGSDSENSSNSLTHSAEATNESDSTPEELLRLILKKIQDKQLQTQSQQSHLVGEATEENEISPLERLLLQLRETVLNSGDNIKGIAGKEETPNEETEEETTEEETQEETPEEDTLEQEKKKVISSVLSSSSSSVHTDDIEELRRLDCSGEQEDLSPPYGTRPNRGLSG